MVALAGIRVFMAEDVVQCGWMSGQTKHEGDHITCNLQPTQGIALLWLLAKSTPGASLEAGACSWYSLPAWALANIHFIFAMTAPAHIFMNHMR